MPNAMTQRTLPLIVILILSASLVHAQQCESSSSEAKLVRAVAEGIIAADNASDIKTVLNFYDRDAVLMPPNELAVSGHDAIRPRYEALFANFKPAIKGRIDEICVDKKIALVRGHNGGEMTLIKGGEIKQLDDTYLMVLRRGADSKWRISHLMWHRSH